MGRGGGSQRRLPACPPVLGSIPERGGSDGPRRADAMDPYGRSPIHGARTPLWSPEDTSPRRTLTAYCWRSFMRMMEHVSGRSTQSRTSRSSTRSWAAISAARRRKRRRPGENAGLDLERTKRTWSFRHPRVRRSTRPAGGDPIGAWGGRARSLPWGRSQKYPTCRVGEVPERYTRPTYICEPCIRMS